MTSDELRRDAKLIREHGCVADPALLDRCADEIDRLTAELSVEPTRNQMARGTIALAAERDALKSRVAELERRTIACCFCGLQCESLESLKSHSPDCVQHPLHADAKRYRYFVAHKFARYGNGQEHVLYFPAGHQVGHIDSLIDAAMEAS